MREQDKNRVKRAIDHIKAAQTHIENIKEEHRTRLEDHKLDIAVNGLNINKRILEKVLAYE